MSRYNNAQGSNMMYNNGKYEGRRSVGENQESEVIGSKTEWRGREEWVPSWLKTLAKMTEWRGAEEWVPHE